MEDMNLDFESPLRDALGKDLQLGDKVAIVDVGRGSMSAQEVEVIGRTKTSIKYNGQKFCKKPDEYGIPTYGYHDMVCTKITTRVIKLGDNK